MGQVMDVAKVEETALWKQLSEGFVGKGGERDAKLLAAVVPLLCAEASDRMKAMPSLHDQYTLHDSTHLLRVTELMGLVLQPTLEQLNPVEIALLLLSAHFHDQGMIPESDELERLEGSDQFVEFRRDWEIEHPNWREIRARLGSTGISQEEKERCRRLDNELYSAMLSDYFRESHGRRSKEYVVSCSGKDRRWEVAGRNIGGLVAKLCESHALPVEGLTAARGFPCDESVGRCEVDMLYLAIILRLADILDFDRDRCPESLLRTIHFTSGVSRTEWEKHRSVEGWRIEERLIRFTVRCQHPVYEKAAYDYMDRIDSELADAHALLRDHVSKHTLLLPYAVDRSRIKPKDGSYIYHDLEFSLSRDEVVKLLMGSKLYGSESLCVRELLQNALDALRHRRAVIKRDSGADWGVGRVDFDHYVNEQGYEVVCCRDNGMGMDEHAITNYLTKVGRSYYRSPEFERERASFRDAGVDFDPCSRFGVGFMSCFMLGDGIEIRTRRHRDGDGGQGKALLVEINGLGGMLVVRQGRADQPVGTTVKIVARKALKFAEVWTDRVHLLEVLEGYALACEFPIEAVRRVAGIEGSVTIKAGIEERQAFLERCGVGETVTFTQDFSEVDPDLRGYIRCDFLRDDKGRPAVGNNAAGWIIAAEKRPGPQLRLRRGGAVDRPLVGGQICCDGILVCGEPGRGKKPMVLGEQYNNYIRIGVDTFLLDIRGKLKPPLSPARFPPRDALMERDAGWKHVSTLAQVGCGRLWEKVAGELDDRECCGRLWELAHIHGVWVPWMRSKAIWDNVWLPLADSEGAREWIKISSMGRLSLSDQGDCFVTDAGKRIEAPEELVRWGGRGAEGEVRWHLNATVVCLSKSVLQGGNIWFFVEPPESAEEAPYRFWLREPPIGTVILSSYGGELAECLSVECPVPSAGRNHPLSKVALDAEYLQERSDLEGFARSLLFFASDGRNQKALGRGFGHVTHHMHSVGCSYANVDWGAYDGKFRPPYRIWLRGRGFCEITGADLERWAAERPASDVV